MEGIYRNLLTNNCHDIIMPMVPIVIIHHENISIVIILSTLRCILSEILKKNTFLNNGAG